MASILYKWFLFAVLSLVDKAPNLHPIYMSVTEIEHNAKEKTLEVSCRIFTDDFEKALRKITDIRVDLLNPSSKAAMDKLVSSYVQKHLKISVDGKQVILNYVGYEQSEEAIESYFQAEGISSVKKLMVQDNILYEYQSGQMSIIHITVNGNRKSSRLNNPDDKLTVEF